MVNTFPVSIDFTPPNRHGYAKGGLSQKAEEVRQAVDNRDTVLIHVNPEEYEFIKQRFGPPKINPKTGIPQFGWFSDWVAPAVTIGANLFGGDLLGSAGSAVSDALGLGLSETASQALGSGLLGATVGGLTGGAKGALAYGALGAASPYALNALGITGNDGLLSGLGLGSSASSATTASLSPSYPEGEMASLAEASKKYGTSAAESGGLGSLFSGGSLMKAAPLLLIGAALSGGGSKPTQSSAPTVTSPDKNTQTNLSNVAFNRTQTNPTITKRYGYGPSAEFFKDNKLPSSGVVTAAEGQ